MVLGEQLLIGSNHIYQTADSSSVLLWKLGFTAYLREQCLVIHNNNILLGGTTHLDGFQGGPTT